MRKSAIWIYLFLTVFTELIISSLCIEIVSGPLNVSNASLGGIARFECRLSREYDFPLWNINGDDFTVSRLPTDFQFESNSTLYVLIVNPVMQEQNNSCFICVLPRFSGRVESTPATLIIRPPIASHSPSSSSKQPLTISYSSSLQPTRILGHSSGSTREPIATHSYSESSFISKLSVAPLLSTSAVVSTINIPTKMESLSHLSVGVYLGVPAALLLVLASSIAVIGFLIIHRRCMKRKGVKPNERVHQYEDVGYTQPESPTDVKQNPAYGDLALIKDNPVYTTTKFAVQQNPAYGDVSLIKDNPAYNITTIKFGVQQNPANATPYVVKDNPAYVATTLTTS